MLQTAQTVRSRAIHWLGDWHPLVRQIGIASGATVTLPASNGQVRDLNSLRDFLSSYKTDVLILAELPTVHKAYLHAMKNEFRELRELDQRLSSEEWLKPYRECSRHAGHVHLERLGPLRDQRLVQRYRDAVRSGNACGWHMLVAGIVLSLYSIPPRQGLMDYAVHTLWNAVGQASRAIALPANDAESLVRELTADLPRLTLPFFQSPSVSGV